MALVAVKSAMYEWASFAKMCDFVLVEDGKQLPGCVTVQLDNIEKSVSDEIARLRTGYGVYDDIIEKVIFGPWFDPINEDEIKTAILAAIN